jgi:predicted Ser/Thr protein kinase
LTPASGEFGIPNPLGRYTITRLLGRGGMGAVFLAHDTQLDRPVALKVPTFAGTLTAAQKERFVREARAISALRHPNLCPVFDVDEEQGVLFLTMAYIDGQPLSALIERGPMKPDQAVDLVCRIARAMQDAHSHGTTHRDLKPANILIDKSGEPVVMDFGLARRAAWSDEKADGAATAANPGLTQYGSVLGTPAYMPPEQARGDVDAIGPRSDIYSLGVILYELMTGRRPFTGETASVLIKQIETELPPPPTDFYPWIDRAVEKACLKALAKDPADRFQSMADFERALKEAVEPELKVVVPPPLPKPAKLNRREKARKRWWVKPMTCLAAALLVLIVCVGGPTAAILTLIDKIKTFADDHQRAQAEWNAVTNLWDAPAADAKPDTLLPPTFGDGQYRLVRSDTDAADPELGINLPGRRGFYAGPDGEVEVRLYRCPEEEAKAIESKAYDFAQAVSHGAANVGPDSKRRKAYVVTQDTGQRTVTFSFHDGSNSNLETGKLWYAGGWLFWFRTIAPLGIETFPPKYLIEVARRAGGKSR